MEELEEFLLARAVEHDAPSVLFRLACDYLAAAPVIRPGVITLMERIATVRDVVGYEAQPRQRAQLDGQAQPIARSTRRTGQLLAVVRAEREVADQLVAAQLLRP